MSIPLSNQVIPTTINPKREVSPPPKLSPIASAIAYWQGVRSEWQHITWPTAVQLWGQTLLVVVLMAVMTTGLWAMDSLFRTVIQWLVPTS